eukprot:Blabericola_migrator_1__9252@NODE_496_length_8026_cov_206_953889_g380_i0_p1_GENE_NODE_496_length_8026_cov_206_953889_g380_i0NODE_496_length_8026_cov_206_953889_g380_i0_p1_ORF_typecomplete_len329_score30_90YvbH_ext/PF11724_8/0_28_NODE_496_length_8026_cov_206_953889_g380_i08871873
MSGFCPRQNTKPAAACLLCGPNLCPFQNQMQSVFSWSEPNSKEQRCRRRLRHRYARRLYAIQRQAKEVSRWSSQRRNDTHTDAPHTLLRHVLIHARLALKRHSPELFQRPSEESHVPCESVDPAEWDQADTPERHDPPLPHSIRCCGGTQRLSVEFYPVIERLCPFAFCGATDFTSINIKLRNLVLASELLYNIHWIKVCAIMCVMAKRHKEVELLLRGYLRRSRALKQAFEDTLERWGVYFDPMPPGINVAMVQEALRIPEGPTQLDPEHQQLLESLFNWLVDVHSTYTVTIYILEHGSYFFGPTRPVDRLARRVKRAMYSQFGIEC